MKRFCKECGKQIRMEHSHCSQCGTPTQGAEKQEATIAEKQPMPKKTKLMLGSIISVLVILVGLHLWVNNHYSYESVEKRFDAAVAASDSTKIKKLVTHEDGSSISENEAKAFANLVETGGKVHLRDLTNIVFDGKVLGMYDSYKVEVIDQFATYDHFVEGLSFAFNGEEFPVYERDGKHITYGPLAPGDYLVEVQFESDAGETSLDHMVTVASAYGEHTWMDMDIPISMVHFFVENYYDFDTNDAHILINDEKYPITEYGESEEVGPFIIDGSQQVNVVVDMPWGEIISDDIHVDASYMYVRAALISDEDYKGVAQSLTRFGDEYLHALADKSTAPLSSVTDGFKEDISFSFQEDSYYTGQFQELQIDKDSISIHPDSDKPAVSIDARYKVKDSMHSLSQSPELHEDEYNWNVGLVFDEDKKEWLIDTVLYTDIWTEDAALDSIAGSSTLYGPSEETIQTAQQNSLEEQMEEFMVEYTIASVDAINERYFGYVSNYITEDGPRRKEAEDYIDYLDSKDIYEEWLGTELESVEEVDDQSWEVTVIETFNIIKPDSTSENAYRTKVIVKMIDGHYYVDELVETNHIE